MEKNDRILIYNRDKEDLEPEIVMGEKFVRMLYQKPLGLFLGEILFKRRFFSKLFGFFQNRSLSARKIERIARELLIDMDEVKIPCGGFKSFNDFFTRKLYEKVRPVESDPSIVISPCDARLLVVSHVSADTVCNVKGCEISLARLLADERLASKYAGGTMLIYRLCPADYHRFHFPEACIPGESVTINGPLHSVNPIALATGRRILDKNLRQRTILKSAGLAGEICMIEVGAMCVGSIIQTYVPEIHVKRGAQKGMFRFGGSSVILIYKPGLVQIVDDITDYSKKGFETLVKVGMNVGSYITKN